MKNNEDLRSLDIALATEARAMSARLLTKEDKDKLRSMKTQEELVAFLRRTPGWGHAARELPSEGSTDMQFSTAMERQVYLEYEKLYRFAESTAKDFLIFIALRIKCQAILAALRRLSNPGSVAYDDPLPPFFHRLLGYDIDTLMSVSNYEELIAAGGNGIYGDTMRALDCSPATGLPRYAEAADLLEDRYYSAISDFLDRDYNGPDSAKLREIVGFRADLLNISYLLRLRRFNTPPEKAHTLLLPLSGSLKRETEYLILTAATDEEAIGEILASPVGRHLKGLEPSRPERFVRAAEESYFRRVLRGKPTLSAAYAFLVLKEAECDLLRRVFVALQYGADPDMYM